MQDVYVGKELRGAYPKTLLTTEWDLEDLKAARQEAKEHSFVSLGRQGRRPKRYSHKFAFSTNHPDEDNSEEDDSEEDEE